MEDKNSVVTITFKDRYIDKKIDSLSDHKYMLRDLADDFSLKFDIPSSDGYKKYRKVAKNNDKKFKLLLNKSNKVLEDMQELREQLNKINQIGDINGLGIDGTIINLQRNILRNKIIDELESHKNEYYKMMEQLKEYAKNLIPNSYLISSKANNRKEFLSNLSHDQQDKITRYISFFLEKRPLDSWLRNERDNSQKYEAEEKEKALNNSQAVIDIKKEEIAEFLDDVQKLTYDYRHLDRKDKALLPEGMDKEIKSIRRVVTPKTVTALQTTLEKLRQSNKVKYDLERAQAILSNNSVFFHDRSLAIIEKRIQKLSDKIDAAYSVQDKKHSTISADATEQYSDISKMGSATRSFQDTIDKNKRIAEDQRNIEKGTHILQSDNRGLEVKLNDLRTRAHELRTSGQVNSESYKSIMLQIEKVNEAIDRNNQTMDSKMDERITTTIPEWYSDLDTKVSGGRSL